jgi:class 3 adenylate cyclase/DNA-binding SARP family transcriptional activator
VEAEAQRAFLKAILFADLAQYSLRVSEREAETLEFMQACFALIRARCTEYGGELVATVGDGFVALFDGASTAVEFAMAIHQAVDELQGEHPDKARFRVGVHLGEIRRVGSNLYGTAVNIAARLETIAQPGGVCISQAVYQQVRHASKFGFVSGGTPKLKHISEPVAVYHVVAESEGVSAGTARKILSLSVIDGVSVHVANDRPIPMRSQHMRAVLGYLALSANHRETVGRLAELLWPGRAKEAARRALVRTLRTANDLLISTAPGWLRHIGDEVALDVRLLDIDLLRIHDRATLGTVEDILVERADWSEAIMSGTERIGRTFSAWLQVTRHHWQTRIVDALEGCCGRFDAADASVRRAAEALLLIEPSHERAAQTLIKHYRANGNPAAALRVYRQLASLLRRRFGMAPSAETDALIGAVAPDRGARAMPAVSSAASPRIGVAEFVAEDLGAEEAHIVGGFRNELIANLLKFRAWIVFELDGKAATADYTGNVDYVLTARGRSNDGRRELLVTLTDPASHRVVWSDMFQVSIDSWIEAQRNLVRRIAARLEIYLPADRLARTIWLGKGDLSAYDDWLRAEHLLSFWTPAAEDEAAVLLEHVIARSPDFAPAYASLAGIHNVRHLIRPGISTDADRERRALSLGRRAVELDPLDPRNHLVVGWTSAMAHQFELAAFHYELAVNLNPGSPKALISCAQGLAFSGFAERATQLLDEALALSPVLLGYQWCYVVSTRWMIGDFEGALAAAERSANVIIDTPGWRAASLARLGRIDEARRAFAEQVDLAAAVWAGTGLPTPAAVRDWFRSSFPIARQADRTALDNALQLAAGI